MTACAWTAAATAIPTTTRLRLECGVFGVFDTPGRRRRSPRWACTPCSTAARKPAASPPSTASGFHTERHMGHVGDAFAGGDLAERLPGRFAIGHTRYSTAGGSVLRNVQPMFADLEAGGVALAHNGNLTNFLTLREQLVVGRRNLPVDLGLRGDPPPDRPLAESASSSTASSTPCRRSRAATPWWR